MTSEYFFDSYAIIEILKSSGNYRVYLDSEFITTKLNIFEVYYKILQVSQEDADIFLKKFTQKSVDFDDVVISEACKFRLQNKEKGLSMADCIGYIVALKAGVKFLTGDKEFSGMPNVEFVK
jgi:predicted nucleic acid-binding protein